MAMINTGSYEFNSLFNAMDFVKSLIIEGYSVAINPVYKKYPRENDIDKFIVDVGKKGCKMAMYDPDEKSCNTEE